MAAQMNQTDPGNDLMHPPLQKHDHSLSLLKRSRLAKNFTPQKNQRICAQHERIRNPLRHGASLAMRIELANFQRRQMVVGYFGRIAGHDLKIDGQ